MDSDSTLPSESVTIAGLEDDIEDTPAFVELEALLNDKNEDDLIERLMVRSKTTSTTDGSSAATDDQNAVTLLQRTIVDHEPQIETFSFHRPVLPANMIAPTSTFGPVLGREKHIQEHSMDKNYPRMGIETSSLNASRGIRLRPEHRDIDQNASEDRVVTKRTITSDQIDQWDDAHNAKRARLDNNDEDRLSVSRTDSSSSANSFSAVGRSGVNTSAHNELSTTSQSGRDTAAPGQRNSAYRSNTSLISNTDMAGRLSGLRDCHQPRQTRPQVPSNDKREMTEALQIVAHTWAKAQISAGQQHQSLTQELSDAKTDIDNLTEMLESARLENVQHANAIAAHKDREHIWSSTVSKLKDNLELLHDEMDEFREGAHIQQTSLLAAEEKLSSLRLASADMEHEITRGTTSKIQKLNKKMLKVMNKMKEQLQTSQVSAEYLLMQVEEKTGLLVEARDEIRLLRSRQSDKLEPAVDRLVEKFEAGKDSLVSRLEALQLPFDYDNRIVTMIKEVTDGFEATQRAKAAESEEVQASWFELTLELISRNAAQSTLQQVKPEMLRNVLTEQFSKLSDVMEQKLQDWHRSAGEQTEMQELSQQLKQAKQTNARLVDQLDLIDEMTDRLDVHPDCMTDSQSDNVLAKVGILAETHEALQDHVTLWEAEVLLEKTRSTRERPAEKASESLVQVDTAETIMAELTRQLGALYHGLPIGGSERLASIDKIMTENETAHSDAMKALRDDLHRLRECSVTLTKEKADLELEVHRLNAEKGHVRSELVSLSDENCPYHGSTPLLEEELAVLRDQLDASRAADAETKVMILSIQQTHTDEVTNLKTQLSEQEDTALKMSKVIQESNAENTVLMSHVLELRAEIGCQSSTLFKTSEDLTKAMAENGRFKNHVDKMWQCEQQRHASEMRELRKDHTNLEMEMCKVKSTNTELNEKLTAAEIMVKELQNQIEQRAMVLHLCQQETAPLTPYFNLSEELPQGTDHRTPDSALDEIAQFLSTSMKEDEEKPTTIQYERPMAPILHLEHESPLGSVNDYKLQTSASTPSQGERRSLRKQRQAAVDQKTNPVVRTSRSNAKASAKRPAVKRQQEDRRTTQVKNEFRSMLRSSQSSSPRSRHLTTPPQHATSARRQPKQRISSSSNKLPLGSTDTNQRTRPHSKRLTKHEDEECFDLELD